MWSSAVFLFWYITKGQLQDKTGHNKTEHRQDKYEYFTHQFLFNYKSIYPMPTLSKVSNYCVSTMYE